jgi:hypothetical protein
MADVAQYTTRRVVCTFFTAVSNKKARNNKKAETKRRAGQNKHYVHLALALLSLVVYVLCVYHFDDYYFCRI